ncbi:MAG: thiamine diphosphokinase [Chloroflexi bacterium]|nr:thiamine diphosphokinase [Chloroflexota bacterium]
MRIVILANGEPPSSTDLQRWLRPGDMLFCADGGARTALRHGLRPQVVIGDFDSLEPFELEALVAGGAQMLRHPPAKDETDLELGLLLAAQRSSDAEIVILGALGGRIDHALANMLLLAMPALRGRAVCIAHGADRVMLIDARVAPAEHGIDGGAGDTVSLLPFGGDAHGIHTEGLHYPLRGESLFVGPARGVSNVMLTERAVVRVGAGLLLCVHTAAA